MFSTPDGTLLAVSRPSLADVVGIDIATNNILWRFPMEGYRTDHMGVSPDGKKLLVSDSTANKVHVLNLRTGAKLRGVHVRRHPAREQLHRRRALVFHASIGRIYVPGQTRPAGRRRQAREGQAGVPDRRHETFTIVKQWDMAAKLAEAGFPGMSPAVRPMAVAPDERFVYLQVSFFHGVVEFDTAGAGKVTRVALLPESQAAQKIPRNSTSSTPHITASR